MIVAFVAAAQLSRTKNSFVLHKNSSRDGVPADVSPSAAGQATAVARLIRQ